MLNLYFLPRLCNKPHCWIVIGVCLHKKDINDRILSQYYESTIKKPPCTQELGEINFSKNIPMLNENKN